MDNEYYILLDGEKTGPFSFQELTEQGLDIDTQVSTALSDTWQNASYVPEFAEYFESKGFIFPTEDNLAGFGWRGIAFIIDYFLLSIMLLTEVLAGWVVLPDFKTFGSYTTIPLKTLLPIELSVIVGFLLYNTLFEISPLRGSIGKKLCKVVVVDEDGRKLSFFKALGRNAGALISLMFYGLPFLTVFLSDRKQTWSDRLVKAYTIKLQ